METGICTKTLSCVFVSTCTSNCRTFMLIRRTTFSMNGVFQLRPGPATRANLPRRWTMATSAVCTVKKDPRTAPRTSKRKITPKMVKSVARGSMRGLLGAVMRVIENSSARREEGAGVSSRRLHRGQVRDNLQLEAEGKTLSWVVTLNALKRKLCFRTQRFGHLKAAATGGAGGWASCEDGCSPSRRGFAAWGQG